MRPHSLAWYDMAKACFTQEQWYSNFSDNNNIFMYSSLDSRELLQFSSEKCILSSDHRSIKALVVSRAHDFPLFAKSCIRIG